MLLDDVARALLEAGVGHLTPDGTDWQIYLGYLQDAPDRAVCVYESGGEVPETNWLIDRPHFQVRVRGLIDDYKVVREKEQQCFLALHSQEVALTAASGDQSPPGARWIYCMAIQSGPIAMGQDEKRRPNLSRNYRAMRERDT